MKEIYNIYLTEKNQLIYKKTRNPNKTNINEYNSFGHKLILRQRIVKRNKKEQMIDIDTWSDLYVR